jgi:hypothetical protein
LNGHYYICFKKIQTKNLLPTGRTGQTGFFEYFGLYFFEINIMMTIRVFILFRISCSIRIWNQISKKIFKLNVFRPTNGQTEFDRVPTLNYICTLLLTTKWFPTGVASINNCSCFKYEKPHFKLTHFQVENSNMKLTKFSLLISNRTAPWYNNFIPGMKWYEMPE